MSHAKSAEKVVQDIRRKTRRRFSAEEKIRIVLEGMRGEESAADRGLVSSRKSELESLLPVEQRVSRSWEETAGWGYPARGHVDGSHGPSAGEWPAEACRGRAGPRESATQKRRDGLRLGGRYVRHTAAETYEVIRLVEGADLSVRQTLRELQVNRSTFYAW